MVLDYIKYLKFILIIFFLFFNLDKFVITLEYIFLQFDFHCYLYDLSQVIQDITLEPNKKTIQ